MTQHPSGQAGWNMSSSGSGIVRSTVLRSTLPGEYLSLWLMCHALFGVATWSLYLPQNPVSLLMIACGLWIALRAVGGFAGERWAACLSFAMLLTAAVLSITGIDHVPGWLNSSPVSPLAWTGMLCLVCVVDVLDNRTRWRKQCRVDECRQRDGRTLKRTFAALFLAWGVGVPIGTLIHQQTRPARGPVDLEEMTFVEHVGFRCGEALVTACFLALGANIGSFLNVVVWRMPLGISIVHGDSRCPVCSTKIESRDNIPIFGWLGLGGRCRACHTDISPRYLRVEAITGSIFLILYFAELISGGANLPMRPVNLYRGVLWIIMYAKWDLIGLYMFHCFLFSSLLVWTLMAMDGHRIPRRLLVFCFTVAVCVPVLFPTLALVPVGQAFFYRIRIAVPVFLQPILFVVMGVLAGLLMGRLLQQRLIRDAAPPFRSPELCAALALMGAVLGWQAVLTMSALFPAMVALRRWIMGTRVSYAGDLLLALMIHHLTWRLPWMMMVAS